MNTLYYGDNLKILRDHIKAESVDLVYLDPPFNSNRTYNVLFKDESGSEADAQIKAFDDTWHWGPDAEATYQELLLTGDKVGDMVQAMRQFIKENQMMAYLVMMAVRLKELHRVLKPTGSLYLHCDPTASHYLKILLDAVFSGENYRNEIVWERFGAHNDANRFGRVADTIFFYSKSNNYTFNPIRVEYSEDHLKKRFRYSDPDGRKFWPNTMLAPGGRGPSYEWNGHTRNWRFTKENMEKLAANNEIYYSEKGMPYRKNYLDSLPGQLAQSIWTDIKMTKSGVENLGYPTQKPVALLERILQASSNEGDIVLDPFCGCGTTIDAAETLKRKWIGIDVTHLSIALQKYRLKDAHGLDEKKDYAVIGEPEDIGSAQQLATEDRYQFQWWALSLIKARPLGATGSEKTGKKGSDKGIDGIIPFIDDTSGKAKRILVQVKSGHVKSGDIRDLKGTIEREQAAMGIFITLEKPSRDMETEAVTAGYYNSPHWGDFPKIQIATIENLLNGKEPKLPPQQLHTTFQKAEKVNKADSEQGGLF